MEMLEAPSEDALRTISMGFALHASLFFELSAPLITQRKCNGQNSHQGIDTNSFREMGCFKIVASLLEVGEE